MTYVYVVIYEGLDWTYVAKVLTSQEKADEYVKENGGWHSEIHRYQIEKWRVE